MKPNWNFDDLLQKATFKTTLYFQIELITFKKIKGILHKLNVI